MLKHTDNINDSVHAPLGEGKRLPLKQVSNTNPQNNSKNVHVGEALRKSGKVKIGMKRVRTAVQNAQSLYAYDYCRKNGGPKLQ